MTNKIVRVVGVVRELSEQTMAEIEAMIGQTSSGEIRMRRADEPAAPFEYERRSGEIKMRKFEGRVLY